MSNPFISCTFSNLFGKGFFSFSWFDFLRVSNGKEWKKMKTRNDSTKYVVSKEKMSKCVLECFHRNCFLRFGTKERKKENLRNEMNTEPFLLCHCVQGSNQTQSEMDPWNNTTRWMEESISILLNCYFGVSKGNVRNRLRVANQFSTRGNENLLKTSLSNYGSWLFHSFTFKSHSFPSFSSFKCNGEREPECKERKLRQQIASNTWKWRTRFIYFLSENEDRDLNSFIFFLTSFLIEENMFEVSIFNLPNPFRHLCRYEPVHDVSQTK